MKTEKLMMSCKPQIQTFQHHFEVSSEAFSLLVGHSRTSCGLWLTLVLGEVRPAVQLALVVRHVGLPGDGGGSAVGQRAPHLLALGLLHGAVHAVELWSACGGQQRPP